MQRCEGFTGSGECVGHGLGPCRVIGLRRGTDIRQGSARDPLEREHPLALFGAEQTGDPKGTARPEGLCVPPSAIEASSCVAFQKRHRAPVRSAERGHVAALGPIAQTPKLAPPGVGSVGQKLAEDQFPLPRICQALKRRELEIVWIDEDQHTMRLENENPGSKRSRYRRAVILELRGELLGQAGADIHVQLLAGHVQEIGRPAVITRFVSHVGDPRSPEIGFRRGTSQHVHEDPGLEHRCQSREDGIAPDQIGHGGGECGVCRRRDCRRRRGGKCGFHGGQGSSRRGRHGRSVGEPIGQAALPDRAEELRVRIVGNRFRYAGLQSRCEER